MARPGDFRQASRDAKLREQRLYPRVQGLAWTVAAGRLAFAKDHPEAARRAGDRGGAAGGAASYDDYVGIDRSIIHGPFSRWISTVLSET